MNDRSHWIRQPAVGIVTFTAGMAGLVITGVGALGQQYQHLGGAIALSLALIAALILAYEFPIYIRHNTKISVISVPLFLMAALLPVPLAGSAAFLSLSLAELAVHRKRGTHPSDIATQVGRFTVLVLAGSALAHIATPLHSFPLRDLPLLGTGVLLWVGDFLSLPLGLTPICGERPQHIWVTAIREAGLAEGAQYSIGILGVLLAQEQLWALPMLVVPAALVYMTFKKEIDPDTFQLLESMADSVDLRDPFGVGHSRRVAELVQGILDQYGMNGQEARQIMVAARVHEIGKIGLPDEVAIKSGPLTPQEQKLYESCPDRAADMLSGYPDFSRGIEMVRHHRERWDGTGYPAALRATDIPFGARIIAVADAFDAMTHDRSYRRALTADQAAQILLDGRNRQWDGAIVDAFLRSIGDRLTVTVTDAQPAPADTIVLAAERVTA